MTQLTSWIHRYTLRDLLDDSFDLFKERVITLLMAGAPPYLLLVTYQVLMRFYVLPGNFLRDMSDVNKLMGNSTFWLYCSGLVLISAIAFAVSLLAQSRVAISHVFGEPVSWHSVYRGALAPALRLIGVGVIYALFISVVSVIALLMLSFILMLIMALGGAMGLGSMAIAGNVTLVVITVILFYALLMLALVLISALFLSVPVLVAHGHYGVFAALDKSFRYTAANYKANVVAFYVLLHLPILFTILAAGLQMLLIYGLKYIAPTAGEVAGSTIVMLISSLSFSAIVACQSALTYVDGQCRLEAFDLRLMAHEMGLEAEMAQAFQATAAPVQMYYPAYATTPAQDAIVPDDLVAEMSTPAIPLFPDYSAPPPELDTATSMPPATGATAEAEVSEAPQPVPVEAPFFPDYSVPPPALDTAASMPLAIDAEAEATVSDVPPSQPLDSDEEVADVD